jgi:outer membrane protein insertion porin family
MKFEIVNDTRNSYMMPTKGGERSASFEYAGGILQGDTDFTREELEASQYIPIFGRHVFRLLGKYGTMEEFGDSESVPIFERFFLGGRNTVHGYDYRHIGPKDETGEPLGGKSMLLLSAEYTYPIYENILRGAVFYDTGSVSVDSYEFNTEDMKAGWGVGLRILIPKLNIPVNLDYSWPLDADEFDEDEGRFDFSLGFDF